MNTLQKYTIFLKYVTLYGKNFCPLMMGLWLIAPLGCFQVIANNHLRAFFDNLDTPDNQPFARVKKISYEIFSKVVNFFQKVVTKISYVGT
ncbi:MAG: hypothetical protein J5552_02620 [Prevotella sp.]|nr:hypothetical protein [Prevotella sp.]